MIITVAMINTMPTGILTEIAMITPELSANRKKNVNMQSLYVHTCKAGDNPYHLSCSRGPQVLLPY